MRRQRDYATFRSKYLRRYLAPEWCVCDVGIHNVMHCYRHRRDWSARIHKAGPAVIIYSPATVRAEHHVLPADLAHVMRGRPGSGRLQIDDANALYWRHLPARLSVEFKFGLQSIDFL